MGRPLGFCFGSAGEGGGQHRVEALSRAGEALGNTLGRSIAPGDIAAAPGMILGFAGITGRRATVCGINP